MLAEVLNLETALAIAAACAAIVSAGYWFAAARLKPTFDFTANGVRPESEKSVHAALSKTARLNRTGALWMAGSAVLTALAAAVLAGSTPVPLPAPSVPKQTVNEPTKRETLIFLRQKLAEYARIKFERHDVGTSETVTDITLSDDGVLAWTTRVEGPSIGDQSHKGEFLETEAVLLVNSEVENGAALENGYSALTFRCVEEMPCVAECSQARCQLGPWTKIDESRVAFGHSRIVFDDKREQDILSEAFNHLIDLLRRKQ